MGSKVLDASTLRGRFHNVPNRLGGDSVAPYLLQPTDSPEDHTAVDTSRRSPLIDGAFRPHWNRDCSDVFTLTGQVSDHPMLLANPQIFHSESNQFGSP